MTGTLVVTSGLQAVDKSGVAQEKKGMTKEQIRDSITQRPFRPFKVRLPDGLEIEVPTGDHAHLHSTGRTLFIHLPDGGTKIIDVALVSAMETTETT